MFNYFKDFKIARLAKISFSCVLLTTSLVARTANANSENEHSNTCKSNNGHGNNQTTELTQVSIERIDLDDGATYILDYVVGTIDPSNPSHSALNLIDIYVDGVQVRYRDLLESQVLGLLEKIKAVEDIELTGTNPNSSDCSDDSDEDPNDNPNEDLDDNPDEDSNNDSEEVVLYAD